MTNLTGGHGELRFTVDVVRADGTKETHELVGAVKESELRAIGIDPEKLKAKPIFPGARLQSRAPNAPAPDQARPVFPPKPEEQA